MPDGLVATIDPVLDTASVVVAGGVVESYFMPVEVVDPEGSSQSWHNSLDTAALVIVDSRVLILIKPAVLIKQPVGRLDFCTMSTLKSPEPANPAASSQAVTSLIAQYPATSSQVASSASLRIENLRMPLSVVVVAVVVGVAVVTGASVVVVVVEPTAPVGPAVVDAWVRGGRPGGYVVSWGDVVDPVVVVVVADVVVVVVVVIVVVDPVITSSQSP